MPEDTPEKTDSTEVGKEKEKGQSREGFPCLEIVGGPDIGTRIALKEGRLSLGRAHENAIVLEDSSISRNHALLEVNPDKITISDVGSRNGIRVNGDKIQDKTELAHGTKVKLGLYECVLLKSADPVPGKPKAEVKEKELKEVAPKEPEAPIGMDDIPEEAPMQEVKSGGLKTKLIKLSISLIVLFGVGFALYKFVLPKYFPELNSNAEGQKVSSILSDPLSASPGEDKTAPTQVPVVLDFSSAPMPAEIFYGDKKMGKTPFKAPITLERNKIYEVKAVYHLPEVGEVLESKFQFSPPKDEQIVSIPFEARVGMFKVASLPRDATIYLEAFFERDPYRAKPIKFTDFIFGKPVYVPYGKYVLEIRKSRRMGDSNTYIDEVVYRRKFSINKEMNTYVLKIKEGALEEFPVVIHSKPSETDVYFDDKLVGKTPYTGMLPLGQHSLQLKREGFFDHSQEIKMLLNAPFELDLSLRTSAAGEKINLAKRKIREGRYSEAQSALTDALRISGGDAETAEINYLFGLTLLRLGKSDDAAVYFDRSEKNEEFKFASKLGKGFVAEAKGDQNRALQLFIEVYMEAEDPKVKSDAAGLFQKLSPLKSVLYIVTDPPGANVVVNTTNKMNKVTPIILHELGIGTYRIHIEKQGYLPEEIKVNLGISEFKPIITKLQRPKE